jgi:hypothetical protein
MAVKQELEMVISEDGTVVLTTRGFKGAECDDALRQLDQTIGQSKSRSRTSEYYEKARVGTKITSKTK